MRSVLIMVLKHPRISNISPENKKGGAKKETHEAGSSVRSASGLGDREPRMHRFLGFAAILALVLISAACASKRPGTVSVVLNASAVPQGQPSSVWRTGLSAPSVDFVERMGDRLLVGTMYAAYAGEYNMRFLVMPRYGPVVLLDAASGRLLWQRERQDLPGGYVLASVSPVIVLRGQKKDGSALYEAIDPATGKQIWEQSVQGIHSYLVATSPDMLVIAEGSTSGEVELRAVALTDGRIAWKRKLAAPVQQNQPEDAAKPQNSAVKLLQADGDLIVLGGGVSSLSLSSGEARWTVPLPSPFNASTKVVAQGEDLFISTGGSTARLSLRDGKYAWQRPGEIEVELLEPRKEAVLRVTSGQAGKGAASTLEALDAASGRTLWRHTMRGPIQSTLLVSGGTAFYTTASHIVGVSMRTGAQIFEQPFDVAGTEHEHLPDLLFLRGQNVVAARETGVAAFSARNGAKAWDVKVDGAIAYYYPLEQGPSVSTPPSTGGPPAAPALNAAPVAMPAVNTAKPQYVQAAQDYARSVESGPHTPGEGIAAADRAIAATRSWQKAQQTQATIALVGAATVAATQIFTRLYVAQKVAERQEAFARTGSLKLGQALQFHFGSVAGDWYFRPFNIEGGLGLTVVNLYSGRLVDLWLTPKPRETAKTVLPSPSNLMPPLFAVNPDQQLVYAVGTGLDVTKFATYRRDCLAQGPSGGGLYECEIPYPAIMAFDLRTLGLFQETKETHALSPSQEVKEIKGSPAAPPVTLVILKTANVREQASAKSRIITTLKKEDKVNKIGQAGDWCNVKLPSGITGWISKSLVKEIAYPTPATTGAGDAR